jgi:hypothetical protein
VLIFAPSHPTLSSGAFAATLLTSELIPECLARTHSDVEVVNTSILGCDGALLIYVLGAGGRPILTTGAQYLST